MTPAQLAEHKANQAGRLQAIADRTIEAFRTGNVPEALAAVFLTDLTSGRPASKWSLRNRFLAALFGHPDARGFRQWQKVGRRVRKGEKAFYILGPCTRVAKEDEPERGIEEGDTVVMGFKPIPVYGYAQTDGDPLPERARADEILGGLPLLEVARQWGIRVDVTDALPGANGSYSPKAGTIVLAVENLSTWAHELMHAADHRVRGTIKGGQHPDQEVVAELGGAVLLLALGYERDADVGGAWNYIQAQVEGEDNIRERERKALALCYELVERTCNAVALVLETAEAVDYVAERPGVVLVEVPDRDGGPFVVPAPGNDGDQMELF